MKRLRVTNIGVLYRATDTDDDDQDDWSREEFVKQQYEEKPLQKMVPASREDCCYNKLVEFNIPQESEQ